MTLPLWSTEPPASADKEAAGSGHPGASRQPPRTLTLVRLSAEIARSLSGIGRVAVEGEVYRPQKSRAGWTYFTLRDRAAQLPVACPARAARRCRAIAGERVVVVGVLVWGNDRGQLVLEAEEVTPVGAGAVAAMIAEARARLAAEGLLARARRPIPRLPRVIGVLCGVDAAVRKDIESVVAARFPGYPLAVEETTVSGPGAALAIMDGLARLCSRAGVDVVVLARGGGDATSLLPWSDEDLCRAVAACPKPVVSAIGHEEDRPLCDDVADLRCGTPSIAAHAVVPDRGSLEAELAALLDRAVRATRGRTDLGRERLRRTEVAGALAAGLERASRRVQHASDRMAWAYPGPAAETCRRRLGACDWQRPMSSRLASGRQHLDALARHARSLSPEQVVRRGFAVVRRPDGTIVRSPDQVSRGERLAVTVAHGIFPVKVEPDARVGRPKGAVVGPEDNEEGPGGPGT